MKKIVTGVWHHRIVFGWFPRYQTWVWSVRRSRICGTLVINLGPLMVSFWPETGKAVYPDDFFSA